MAQLSCYRYTSLLRPAEANLSILTRALDDLGKRWPTAVGSLKHLIDVREKALQRPSLGAFPDVSLPPTTAHFFDDFGPELCSLWEPVHARMPQNAGIAPRELETAGILQGLRTPAAQSVEMEVAMQAQMMGAQGQALEPTMLQPQEWNYGPYGGIGNWLVVDWNQGLQW